MSSDGSKLDSELKHLFHSAIDGSISKEQLIQRIRDLGFTHSDVDTVLINKIYEDTSKISYDEWKCFFDSSNTLERKLVSSEAEKPVEHWSSHIIKPLIAGAVVGGVSRTSTAPFERLKILFQINRSNPPTIIQGLSSIYQKDGILGFWRGNGANVLKVAPEKAFKYTVFETSKRLFAKRDYDLKPWQLFACGSMSGVATHTVMFPLDVIKTRLAGTDKSKYSGIRDVLKKVFQGEGGLKPFYRGLSVQLTISIPHSGLNLMSYELIKKLLYARNESPNPFVISAGSAISSTGTHLIIYPMQVIKTRMMMGTPGNMFSIFKDILKKEGRRGFFKGFMPSIMKSTPSHAISIGVYEITKNYLNFDHR
ncbi:mitochondrial substrate carrier family protein C [Acrasis kona]|uniref:Mitochondrial substrate carrier family protein C n=1 Tax=Acrasis kona TaxID=1008807 RepID=A0AAW2Z3R9_9EUKA